MKIYGVGVTGQHGGQLKFFAAGIGSCEIHTLDAQHDADNRKRQLLAGSSADAHHDRGWRLNGIEGPAAIVAYLNSQNLPAAVPMTVNARGQPADSVLGVIRLSGRP